MLSQIKESTAYIQSKTNVQPTIGIILGTGLGGLVKEIEIIDEINYQDIPHFPVSTVESHSGKLIFGRISGKNVVAMQGRFHYYEGYTLQQVTFPVRVMKLLGIDRLFVSNASGGVNPEFEVGEIMIMNDHINLFPGNPLIGPNIDELGPRFPDMSDPYDQEMIDKAGDIAKNTQAPALPSRHSCAHGTAKVRYVRKSNVKEVNTTRPFVQKCFTSESSTPELLAIRKTK